MNKIKRTSFLVILLGLGLLQSCLKDTPFLDVSNTQPIIEFVGTAGFGPILTPSSQSFGISTPLLDVDTSIALNIASPQVLSYDVKVVIKRDSALVDSLNSQGGLAYENLPEDMYKLVSDTVTIKAGYRIGRLKLRLNNSKYDFANHSYAIGFKIVKADGMIISGNANSFIWTLDVKNQYDGVYLMRGYTLRLNDAAKTGYFSNVKRNLVTSGVNSVDFDNLLVWADGTGVGIDNPSLTINADNSIDITSPGGGKNDPNYNSHYDPTSKTFFISVTWGAGPSARLSTDTLVYQGPR